MWERFPQTFADADKTGAGDDNLCWAAAAANQLTWAGWTGSADEDDTLDIFRAKFRDKPGYVYDALEYYFGKYKPGVAVGKVAVREAQSHMLIDFIVKAAHAGKGIALKINYPGKKIGHFLTFYGYRALADEHSYKLYFADSDDGLHQIRQFEVKWKENRWDIQSFYRGYYLVYALSLADPTATPAPPPPPPPTPTPTCKQTCDKSGCRCVSICNQVCTKQGCRCK